MGLNSHVIEEAMMSGGTTTLPVALPWSSQSSKGIRESRRL